MVMTWGMIIFMFFCCSYVICMFLCDHVNIDKIRCGLNEWVELS